MISGPETIFIYHNKNMYVCTLKKYSLFYDEPKRCAHFVTWRAQSTLLFGECVELTWNSCGTCVEGAEEEG